MPRQSDITTYIQTSPRVRQWRTIHELSLQKGFLMAPFDTRNGKKYILVAPELVIHNDHTDSAYREQLLALPGNPLSARESSQPVVTEKESYLQQVAAIKQKISTGYFQKAVLSRIRLVEGDYLPVITQIFLSVCENHPNAFVYMFRSDDHFWMGASPEPLLRLSDGFISTVSLAGTRPYHEKNMEVSNWTMKEVVEQEYVTRYIHDKLREFQIRDYRVTSPYVKRAGEMLHLRTDFSFDFNLIGSRIWELLDAMHPTPAVAGQPKDEAISFIKAMEPHDREYYTGFLGPVQSTDRIDLFVNLRCMKITPGYLALYVGGGITLESDPEEEWEETELKLKSLLSSIGLFSTSRENHHAVPSTHR